MVWKVVTVIAIWVVFAVICLIFNYACHEKNK